MLAEEKPAEEEVQAKVFDNALVIWYTHENILNATREVIHTTFDRHPY